MLEIDKLWNYNDPKATHAKFMAEKEKVSLKTEPETYLQLLTQMARAEGLQSDFETAHNTLDQVKAHWHLASPLVKVRYALERGRVFNSSGKKEEAMPWFQQALTQAQAAKLDFYAVDAAHMLVIVTPAKEQIKWNEMAMALAESSQDPRAKGWLGSLYNNLAWTYHDLKNYDQALALFEKNVIWHEAKQSKMPLIIAKYSVGRTLRSLKQYEKAIKIHQALLVDIHTQKLAQDGYIYEELGENFLALGQDDVAKPHFKKAYELLSKDTYLIKHEAKRLSRLKDLAK